MNRTMRHITLKEMLYMEVEDLLHCYPSGGFTYLYKNEEGEYHEIISLDILREGFVTDNGHFYSFDSQIAESHIYVLTGDE